MAQLLDGARNRRIRRYVEDLDWLVDERDGAEVSATEFGINRSEIVASASALTRGSAPSVIVTPVIVLVAIATFIYEAIRFDVSPTAAQLDTMGAIHAGAISSAEWWRVITGSLLHANIQHLVVNVVAAIGLIGAVELRIGPARTLRLVLVGMIGSALGCLLYTPVTAVVGSSGVIFAAAGAMLTLPRGQRGIEMRITGLAFVALGVVQAIFFREGIAIACHAGGLVAGLAFGFESQDRGRIRAARQAASATVPESEPSGQADISSHALTAFILSIWPLGVTGIAALVLGSLAKEELANDTMLRGRKIANAAVILGWTQIIGLIFVIIWSTTVFPTFR